MAETNNTGKFTTILNFLPSLKDNSLAAFVATVADGTTDKKISLEQLGAITKYIGENPSTAVSAATLVGLSLAKYLHIRTKGTEADNIALNRKIRRERRRTEETSDKRVERRRTNKNKHLSESLGSSMSESISESMRSSPRSSRRSMRSKRRSRSR